MFTHVYKVLILHPNGTANGTKGTTMKRREYKQRAWRAVKAFVADEGYENVMDDLTVECSELQWQELLSWIEAAREVLKSPEVVNTGANPLPLIRRTIESRYC